MSSARGRGSARSWSLARGWDSVGTRCVVGCISICCLFTRTAVVFITFL